MALWDLGLLLRQPPVVVVWLWARQTCRGVYRAQKPVLLVSLKISCTTIRHGDDMTGRSFMQASRFVVWKSCPPRNDTKKQAKQACISLTPDHTAHLSSRALAHTKNRWLSGRSVERKKEHEVGTERPMTADRRRLSADHAGTHGRDCEGWYTRSW